MHGVTDQYDRRHPNYHDTPYDSYHKIHKRFVGPATADKLRELYQSLAQSERPREVYAAGWAAAEAALVGTGYVTAERVRLAQGARESWESSLLLEQDRAAHSAHEKGTVPDTTDQYRIASTLALAPIIEAIPQGIIPKETLRSCYGQLLETAELNHRDMLMAEAISMEGRVNSHMGVAYEQIAALGINRMMSSRIVSLFSLARSGTGFHYPHQTHDMMVLNLDKNNIVRVTPTEVKSQLKVKFSNRYEAALVGGKAILGTDRQLIGRTLRQFRSELEGTIAPSDTASLDAISAAIIHSVRHHHRAEQFGRHCLDITSCSLEQPLAAS